MKIYTVFIFDDNRTLAEDVKVLLNAEKDLEVIGIASCTEEGLRSAIKLKPDILLMDNSRPDGAGSKIAREVKKSLPAAYRIIYSQFSLPGHIKDALKSGVHGIIDKEVSPKAFMTGIRSVINGKYPFIFSSGMNLYMDTAETEEGQKTDNFHLLTPREKEIFLLIAEGSTNYQIADHLGLSTKTVDSHRTNLMRKLEIHSVRDLIKLAIRKNVIQP